MLRYEEKSDEEQSAKWGWRWGTRMQAVSECPRALQVGPCGSTLVQAIYALADLFSLYMRPAHHTVYDTLSCLVG
eukprot:1183730-Pleurochrysis_carterae.AAC.1